MPLNGDYKLCDGAYLIPHKTDLTQTGRKEKMYRGNGIRKRYDDFSHEQSLVLDTQKGLVIINSCSHGGVVNIINEVKSTFPGKNVYGIVGGFHLFNKTDDEVRMAAKAINDTGISSVYTGHCTKDRAYGIMETVLGGKLHNLSCGFIMTF